MQIYKAPLRDMRFVLHELLDAEQLSKLPGYEEATADTIDAIIEEGAKFCEDKLLPLNRVGDEEGWENWDGDDDWGQSEDSADSSAAAADTIDMTALESSFVRHAASYGDRRNISYAAWREAGVSSATLKAAGIRRSR